MDSDEEEDEMDAYFKQTKLKESKICERLAKYIGQRLKTNMIIDAFAGVGYLTLQFARNSQFVLAIEPNATLL